MLYVRSVDVQPEDLTARARIREAALELFARAGVERTSMRSVAARAHVSPSLVVHHFRSKVGLREAVDDAVLRRFATTLATVDLEAAPPVVARQLEKALSGIVGGDEALRGYLARSLLDASPASQRLFDQLMDLLEAGLASLEAAGHLQPGLDRTWRSYAAAFVILGPVLLGPQIEARLGVAAFAPEVVEARSACSMAVLRHGLLRTGP